MYVLVVDDVAVAREVLCAVAHCIVDGATVRSAASLDEGLAVAAGMPRVDIVLLDLGLPGCTGLDALHRIRTALPAAKTVVVSASPEESAPALRAGAQAFVAKNRIPGDVFAAIRAVQRGERFQS